jgi:hypothetical protein
MYLITSNHLKMKKVLLLLLVAATFASCTKEASVSNLDSQKGKKDKSSVSALTLTPIQIVAVGEDDKVSIDDVSFGVGEYEYSNYSGNNVHATIHSTDVDYGFKPYIQVWDGANWNVCLAPFQSLTGSIYGFDGFPTDGTVMRQYRAIYWDSVGNSHVSSSVQVN